jgi:hypothetical protein
MFKKTGNWKWGCIASSRKGAPKLGRNQAGTFENGRKTGS